MSATSADRDVADSGLFDTVFPMIEQIVTQAHLDSGGSIDRDTIAELLLDQPSAVAVIQQSLGLGKRRSSRRNLFDKAGNCVDWLNALITGNDPRTIRWNGDFYARKKLRHKHPFTGETRQVYWLAPFTSEWTADQDIRRIGQDRTLTATEKERLVLSRLGQGAFRQSLIKYWNGRCCVTGCGLQRILRASHIKPWRTCDNEARLNHFNGLLLVPSLDAAFDAGLITFAVDGRIVISKTLSPEDQQILRVDSGMRIDLIREHETFMQYHRRDVFKEK